jgi:hypothetical protein
MTVILLEMLKFANTMLSNYIVHTLGTTDQHYALIIISLFITQASTCFGTYVPYSGSVLYPCEILKVRNGCVIGMYRCTVNVGGLCAPDGVVWCVTVCTGWCSLVCYCVHRMV